MLRRMAVLHLISYIPIKTEGVSGLHEIQGDRLGKQEEAK